MTSSLRRAGVAALLLFALTGFLAAQSKTMSVQVREAPVRSSPSFLGPIITDLNYGDRVEVLEVRSGWAHINLPSGKGQGWLHSSELTAEQIALKAGSNVSSGASSSEVALAGKGFNEQVEQEYRSETSLDYTWVDKMEKIAYTPQQLVDFLKAGRLEGSGAAK